MKLLRALLAAIGFLTRLPVGRKWEIGAEDLGRALYFFPWAGALLGALLLVLERVLHGHLSLELIALALTAALAALTGGLHLDGVADICDGLAGGRGNRARTLEIMRDSRIGALGALALALLLIGKVLAVRDVLLLGSPPWAVAL
ncbi:MAG TPA: adenosylcobinamide-GDP ribazoletransferase, partial [Polyangiales bacterium]|nr:adenosylcobinamide-GDP ribazoletransferase [Polyangiales bacterium]